MTPLSKPLIFSMLQLYVHEKKLEKSKSVFTLIILKYSSFPITPKIPTGRQLFCPLIINIGLIWVMKNWGQPHHAHAHFAISGREMGIDGHGWEWYLKLLNQIDTYNSPKMHLIIFIFESRLQCNKNLVAILVKKLKISKKWIF